MMYQVIIQKLPSSSFFTYLLVYILGGLTLLPSILISIWYFSATKAKQGDSTDYPPDSTTTSISTTPFSVDDHEKKGWIRLVEHPPLGSMKKSFRKKSMSTTTGNSDRSSGFSLKSTNNNIALLPSLFFAILRHGTLFCFDTEQEKTCHLILPVHDYTLSLYPSSPSSNKNESELYGRIMSICLIPKNISQQTYYLTCQRPSDKEDWYFALLAAARFLAEDVHDPTHMIDWRDSTMFDAAAMTKLHRLVHNTSDNTQQWWHALMGRLFLGIYKTEDWQSFWHTKLKSKLDKLNTQLLHQQPPTDNTAAAAAAAADDDATGTATADTPPLFSPLELQQIHMGDTIPCLTSMTLDTFDTQGNCVISGQFKYDGDFWAVIRTDFRYLFPTLFNNKKKPAAGLVLSIKLRHFSGKMIFKLKPPPSNRVWVAFESLPQMEWQVTPIVWDKHIKWPIVQHLIQHKINEVVMDTLVMPNMEDVPFFESAGLGGIFGKRVPATPAPAETETATTTTTTTISTKDDGSGGGNSMEEDDDSGGDDSEVMVDKDHSEKHQQARPMVSKLVQGYINRIKAPHKMASALNPGSPKVTKV